LSSVESIVGLVLVLLATVLVVLLMLGQRRNNKVPTFRRISAISRFKKAASQSVEDGTRIHVSLGNASLTQPVSSSAFVSLIALHISAP
jgi:Tfp pilus assembly protein PilX